MHQEPSPRRIAQEYLRTKVARVTTRTLDSRTREAANKMLRRAGLDGNGRFQKAEHGLSKALSVLSEIHIEPAEVISSHRFRESSNHFTVDLAFSNPDDPFSPEPITNTMLVIQYTELAKYRYEVLAYLS